MSHTSSHSRASIPDDSILALQALAWTLADDDRAARFLSLTGLDPDALRASLGDGGTAAAIATFLTAHEPDLISCADHLGVEPGVMGNAMARLSGGHDQGDFS